MVLADLGSKVAVALRKMTQATVIDESVVKEMLMEICKALLQADVNVAQVKHLRENVTKNVDVEALAGVTPDALLGTTMWPSLVHPDDRAAVDRAWRRAHEASGPYEARYRMLTAGGGALSSRGVAVE